MNRPIATAHVVVWPLIATAACAAVATAPAVLAKGHGPGRSGRGDHHAAKHRRGHHPRPARHRAAALGARRNHRVHPRRAAGHRPGGAHPRGEAHRQGTHGRRGAGPHRAHARHGHRTVAGDPARAKLHRGAPVAVGVPASTRPLVPLHELGGSTPLGAVKGVEASSSEPRPHVPGADRQRDTRLPFTGFALLMLAAIGATLLGTGARLRRSANTAD